MVAGAGASAAPGTLALLPGTYFSYMDMVSPPQVAAVELLEIMQQ